VLLIRGVLFAAPFAVWFAWAWWAKRSGRPMGSTPWPWLFAVGAFLIGLSLMAGAVFHRDNRNKVYVPAETTASGAVTKGHFEERAAPKKP
jgi:hypothetical protein